MHVSSSAVNADLGVPVELTTQFLLTYSKAKSRPSGGGGFRAMQLPRMRKRSRGPAYTIPDLNDCHACGVCGPASGQRFVRSHSVCGICFFQSGGSGYSIWEN